MNVRRVCKWCVVGTLLALGSSFGLHRTLFAQPDPPKPEEGVQVLTRGPVHEAFAETVTYDPEPGIVAPKAPPAAIEEVPPEHRPEGAHVAWIPGYWNWDDERSDFLWVSGIWRALPPDRQWVPGYWGKTAQGFQWTSGYWAGAKAREVEYLPEPPATVETGPNVASPSADDTWLPGCWVWQNGRYAWRPGYWAPVQSDWVWIPAHYVWAPRGYVFVDGYWDYAIGRRGILFAPVYFTAGLYGRPGFSYSPSAVINLGVLADNLFLRPRYQHYYFGDYYAANYANAGFYPSYAINTGRFGYDPFYAHERWQHRQDNGWEQSRQAEFQNRQNHENLRPPRTWAGQGLLNASEATSRVGLPGVASLLDDVRRNTDGPQRFQPVDQAERQQFIQRAQDVQRLREERQKQEPNAAAAGAETRAKEFVPTRVPLPGSPIMARSAADLPKEHVAPKIHEAPAPDLKVEPTARTIRSVEQPQQRTVNRIPLDQPQRQPQAEHQAPQPQRQPQAERQAPQPHDSGPAAGPNQDKQKGKDKN
jgi:hypothetical protein